MTQTKHKLVFVSTDAQWEAYHSIRKQVLVDERGLIRGQYMDDHPDDRKPNHFPVLLSLNNEYIGAMRIDIHGNDKLGVMRTVAIVKGMRGKGQGKKMLQLAEDYCLKKECNTTTVVSADDAIEFYQKCGYKRHVWDPLLKDELENQLVKDFI